MIKTPIIVAIALAATPAFAQPRLEVPVTITDTEAMAAVYVRMPASCGASRLVTLKLP